MRRATAVSVLLALVAVAAFVYVCIGTTKLPIDLPPGFVHLEDGGSGFRAMTSDDARLWIRRWSESTEATATFWADVLQQELVQRGYERKAGGEIADRAGRSGRWGEFDANLGGERMRYLIAVWAEGCMVQVVEFGAVAAVYDKHASAVRTALATLRN
ncbi:MAG: hypothetical protein U1F60_09295 [Planctomycetota bacterium]